MLEFVLYAFIYFDTHKAKNNNKGIRNSTLYGMPGDFFRIYIFFRRAFWLPGCDVRQDTNGIIFAFGVCLQG